MVKRGIKKLGIILGLVFLLFLIIIGISYSNHKIQLSKEGRLFIPNGEVIQINGHGIHIYNEGDGEDTLVFMSGGGTSSPVLDFKSLYSILSDEHKIVVVEKSGYGFSEDADIDRDIDTILEETRQALSKIELTGPYILFPHSMSGIEALHWAQEYPEEIQGIVGLDMAVPEAYEDFSINKSILKSSQFGAKIGIIRFFPSIVNDSAAIKHGTLTENEKEIYRAIFYRRTLTNSMFKEINEIKRSAEKVKKNGVPDIPMLFFISNGEGTGWDNDNWIEIQREYIGYANKGKSVELNCQHYVHGIEYEKIAEESKKFIEGIIVGD